MSATGNPPINTGRIYEKRHTCNGLKIVSNKYSIFPWPQQTIPHCKPTVACPLTWLDSKLFSETNKNTQSVSKQKIDVFWVPLRYISESHLSTHYIWCAYLVKLFCKEMDKRIVKAFHKVINLWLEMDEVWAVCRYSLTLKEDGNISKRWRITVWTCLTHCLSISK